MTTWLSTCDINSFCGNVVPLWLKSDQDLSHADIHWQFEGSCFTAKTFLGTDADCFSNGILLTLVQEGTGTVIAQWNGKVYKCSVTVRKRRSARSSDELHAYTADLHIHTSKDHKYDSFALRDTDFPYQRITEAHSCGVLDCSVITDHADVTNKRDFFRGFTDDEETSHDGLVVFPGAESEVTLLETDRFGLLRKNSGEIVTLNTANFANTYNWEDFYTAFTDSPFVTCILAHPHVIGWAQKCIWNFCFHKNAKHPEFQRIIKLIEVVNGELVADGLLHHYAYSLALDCGLKIAPCCDSDSHGTYTPCSGKTFLLSPEKSKEMFYDAIIKHRVYASESGAVDLRFTVNNAVMGETLPQTDTYRFHVETTLINDTEDAMPVLCEVISDYGKTVYSSPFTGTADFTLNSETARYFYLILTDTQHRKTWSAPVWTGREFDDLTFLTSLKPLDKTGFTAYDTLHNTDAGKLINNDPTDVWCAGNTHASVIIDMKQVQRICAVGHYTPGFYDVELDKIGDRSAFIEDRVAGFVCDYRICVSTDGVNFREVRSGFIRNFGGEDILHFPACDARFVRFDALSTVGKDTKHPSLSNSTVHIAELSVFQEP